MSFSISTLLLRNLDDVFDENDSGRRRTAIDEIFHEDAVFYDRNGVYRGRDEIHRIAGMIKAVILTSDISQLPRPRSWAMAGGSDGCRAALVLPQLSPGLISS